MSYNCWHLVGGFSSRRRRQKQGEDVVHTLKVSLEDLYNGATKKLSLSRNILCPKCKGYVVLLCYFYLSVSSSREFLMIKVERDGLLSC